MEAYTPSLVTPRAGPGRSARPALAWLALALGLALLLSLALRAAPPSLARDVAAPEAPWIFHDLGALEQSGQRGFRWSSGDWALALYGLPRNTPATLRLELSAGRPDGAPEAELTYADAGAGGAFRVARAWRSYQLLVAPVAGGDGVGRIVFGGSVFTPPGERNPRQLGVAVHALSAAPVAGDGPLLDPRALFLACLALLLAATLAQLGLRGAWPPACALALAIALGLLLLRAPVAAAYWLPNLWFVAGLWALALLAAPARRALATTGAAWRTPGRAAAGFMLGAVGAGGLWLGAPLWLGAAALLAGVGLATLAAARAAPAALAQGAITRGRQLAALAAITLGALALRLYRINDLPNALWRDEARHGLFALQIWQTGWYRPVYEPAVDLPALILYLIAPLVGIFGPDLWTLRGVVALVGALAPLALWWLLRPLLGARAALLGAALLAASLWAIYMSRWAMPPMLDLALTLAAAGCAVRSLQPGRRAWSAALLAALAGVGAGLALYTYHTGRLAPLAVALIALAAAFDPRIGVARTLRRLALPLLCGAAALALVAAPLALYALRNRDLFSERVDRVGLFRGSTAEPTPPGALLQQNLVRYALMWNVEGDYNARHYAPRRPMLDPVTGTLMLLGLASLALYGERRLGLLLLGWLLLGLLPGILSGDAPHAMRAIGALAPACALAAHGADRLLLRLADRRRGQALLAAGLLLGFVWVWNLAVYLQTASDPAVIDPKFDVEETAIGRAVRQAALDAGPLAPQYPVYLWAPFAAKNVTSFLTADVTYGLFDGARLAPAPAGGALLILPGDAPPAIEASALAALGPGARVVRVGPPRADTAAPLYRVYGAGPAAAEQAARLHLP